MKLIQHRFCPHSRFVRIVLSEYGIPAELTDEPVWERREEFLALNPAGTTPVLIDEHVTVPGAAVIAEYLDETFGPEHDRSRLLPIDRETRVEVRRLMEWFHD
jgi:glutathione S-transferase